MSVAFKDFLVAATKNGFHSTMFDIEKNYEDHGDVYRISQDDVYIIFDLVPAGPGVENSTVLVILELSRVNGPVDINFGIPEVYKEVFDFFRDELNKRY